MIGADATWFEWDYFEFLEVGPLCWLGVLGFATDVSSLKESSIWESFCVWWGSLER